MTTSHPFTVRVTRFVAARPETVYDLVADVTAMSSYSPETVATTWLDGATRAVVGARFAGTNAVGWMRWTTRPTVTVADRGRRFAFVVPMGARTTWTYDFAAADGGTLVTETAQTEKPVPAVIAAMMRLVGVRDRESHLRAGMVTTLDRLAASVSALV